MEKLKNIFLEMGLSIEVTSALLGNIKVESNFIPKAENMNYSSVSRLKAVFPSKFKGMTDLQIKKYVNNPQLLGDLVYNAFGGYKYRGRGYIQLTGKDNYSTYGKLIGVDLINNPDLACNEIIAGKIAVIYIKSIGFKHFKDLNTSKNINYVADCVTKSIQGVGKNYSSGFLKEHLELKRKESIKIYNIIKGA